MATRAEDPAQAARTLVSAAWRRRGGDFTIMAITGVLAGCGLVYEYLLAHTAGRILGAVETVIFSMIGVMIVSMGFGAFLARLVRHPYSGFAWLEASLAALGGLSVLILGGVAALGVLLPQAIADTYGIPSDLVPHGGLLRTIDGFAGVMPYIMGAIIGTLVGMEIPLLARIRQSLHERHLVHNAGAIYGADYIGAGIGAALWVAFMLTMEPALAAVITATVNLAMGLVFLVLYGARVRRRGLVIALHGTIAAILAIVAVNGTDWARNMEDLLYNDRVVHSLSTTHQRLTVTERLIGGGRPPVYSFYINGRTQFASNDEHIYHAMLTYPPLAAAARRERVLVVGGGDGLALRDILRWNPKAVTLLDLDPQLVKLFSQPLVKNGRVVNRPLLELNDFAFQDRRVTTRFGDAFLSVDALIRAGERFDAIIVDLPDPSHPDLNRLYTVRFYTKLRLLLAGDGAMAVQSTSPYHSRTAFLSIGKSIAGAGFRNVEQYHQNVPSFGEWGWTIATPEGSPASRRLQRLRELPVDDGWTTKANMMAAFAFPRGIFAGLAEIEPSRLGNAAAYRYYQQEWEVNQGVYHNPTGH